MYLIILYIITLIFLFAGIAPLKILSVIALTSLLPGITLLTIIKKDGIDFDDFILSFAFSIGLSSLLSIMLLYAGVKTGYIVYLLYFIYGSLALYKGFRNGSNFNIIPSKETISFAFVSIITTLFLSLPLLSDRIAISTHGFHHSSMITQIINGIFPPENPGLGGMKIAYQWGYHAFIAVNAFHIDLAPLRVMNVFNILSLFLIISLVFRSGMLIDIKRSYAFLIPLAILGLMRSDACLFFFKSVLINGLDNTFQLTESILPLDILQGWILGGGAPWFDRRLLFLNKFYNANNMPVGIFLCLAYFFAFLIMYKREGKRHIYYFIISIIIIANIIIYPLLAMVPLIHYPVWTAYSFLKDKNVKKNFVSLVKIGLPYVTALIITLPYMLSITGSVNEPVLRIVFWDQSIRNLVTFWLPAPFIILGFLIWIKSYPREDIKMLFFTGLILTFLFATFTRLPHWNSAKFTYILSYFYAIFFIISVSWLLRESFLRKLRYVVIIFVILFLSFTPLLTETAYLLSPWFKDVEFSFLGKHIVFKKDKGRNGAYQWIRENTPPNSLIIMNYVTTHNPDKIAQNDIYMVSAIAERNLFVVKDWYTEPLTEYKRRLIIREKIFSFSLSKDVIDYLRGLRRPVYIFIEKNPPSNYVVDFKYNMIRDTEGFEPVFENDFQKVYKLKL